MKNLSFLLHNYETCFVFNKIKNKNKNRNM